MSSQATTPRNVVVFGAGLIGLSTAFSLVRRGHHVTLVDKDTVGSGAAKGNAGEVTPLQALPMPEPSQVTEIFRGVLSTKHYLNIAPLAMPRLAAFGIGFLANCTPSALRRNTRDLDQLVRGAFAAFDSYQQDGISLAGGGAGYFNTHTSLDALRAFRDFQVNRAREFNMETPHPIIMDDELHEYEPTLDKHVRAGFLAPTERYLDPVVFVEDLHKALINAGVEIYENTELQAINGSLAKLSTPTGEQVIEFDYAVVAVGAWATGQIDGIKGLGTSFVTGGTGYSYEVTPDVLPKNLTVSLNRKTIVVPMSGHLRVVGLMDFGFDDATPEKANKDRLDHLASQAAGFIPGIKDLPRDNEWTGPRPMTPNGLPIISFVPNNEKVVVATGHNMHGLSLGPVTGEVVTSMIEGRGGEVNGARINLQPFAL